jgi:two-component system, sensor histidine kinase PdtaS
MRTEQTKLRMNSQNRYLRKGKNNCFMTPKIFQCHPSADLGRIGRFIQYALVFSCLFSSMSAKGNEEQARLDSLERALSSMPADSVKYKSLTDLAWAYSRSAPYKALTFAEAAKALANELGDERKQAHVNYYFGVIHKNLGNFNEALEHFKPYIAYFEAVEDKRAVCFVHFQTGIIKSLMGNYSGAVADLYINVRLAQELGLKDTEAGARNAIATIYRKMKDFENAIRLNNEALDIFTEIGDEDGIGQSLGNNANIYVMLKEYQRAMEDYQKALRLFEKTGNQYMLGHIHYNMGKLYLILDEMDQASIFLNKSLQIRESLGHSDDIGKSHEGLGAFYLKNGEIENAVSHFQKALDFAGTTQSLENEKEAVAGLAKSYEAAGDFRASTHHYKLLNILSDSLLNGEITRQVAELNIQYETEIKDTEIALLQKDKAIADRNQWLLALAALALLVVALSISILYRARQTNIRRLEEKNGVISKMLEEKEYLIKEIHHRVKNNLQIISSLLQLQARYVDEPTALEALQDGESRVRSMSIIHHHLYTDDYLSQVHVPKYMANLCDNLRDSYNIRNSDIRIHRHIADIALDVSVMIPLGLILNELITNAFKYAFVGRKTGNIWVQIAEESDRLLVSVKDDGVGIDPVHHRQGFGSRLIHAFLRKLDAEAETLTKGGTEIRIVVKNFRKNAVQQMSA